MADPAPPSTPATPAIPGIPAVPGVPDPSASAAPSLMSQMMQLTQSGVGKDTQFSDAAHKQIIELVTRFRDTLIEQRGVAAGLANYGEVGTLFSAGQAKFHLTSDTTDFLAKLDNVHCYLDQCEKAVNASFARMHAKDNAK